MASKKKKESLEKKRGILRKLVIDIMTSTITMLHFYT